MASETMRNFITRFGDAAQRRVRDSACQAVTSTGFALVGFGAESESIKAVLALVRQLASQCEGVLKENAFEILVIETAVIAIRQDIFAFLAEYFAFFKIYKGDFPFSAINFNGASPFIENQARLTGSRPGPLEFKAPFAVLGVENLGRTCKAELLRKIEE